MLKHIKSIVLWMLIVLSIGLSTLLWVVPSPSMTDAELARYKTPISFGQTMERKHLLIPEAIVVQHQDGSQAMLDPLYLTTFWDEQLSETLSTMISQMQEIKVNMVTDHKDAERYRLSFAPGVTIADIFDLGRFRQDEHERKLSHIEFIRVSHEQENGLIVRLSFDDGHQEEGWISDGRSEYWLKLVPPLSRWITVASISSIIAEHSLQAPSPDSARSSDPSPPPSEGVSEGVSNNNVNAKIEVDKAYDGIPEKSLELPVYIDRFVAISTDDAAEALFLDLSTMRQVKERDGGRIFSDGVRSLKIMGDDRIMRYFSPPLPQMRESTENHDALVSAVQFINRHAGWNGDERLVQRIVQHSGETMIFRSAIDGYPLDTEGDALSYYTIQVELKGGDVIAYERSLWRRISRDGDGRLKLLSAAELMHALKEKVRNPIIQTVRIAYRAELTSTAGAIRLVPGYAITLVDGEMFFFSGQANDETTS